LSWGRIAEKLLYLSVGTLCLFSSLLTIQNSPLLAIAQAFIGATLLALATEEPEK